MSLRQRLASVEPKRETVFTIGVFDGVHQGHCHLLQRLIHRARPGYLPGVITFTNHPATVLRPDFKLSYINTLHQKVRLLKEQGIELVIPLDFSPELAQMGAGEFVTQLVESLHLKGLVIGPDFALGRNRQGNAEFLQELGTKLDFWVETVEPLVLDGILVRSRRVREAISQGEVDIVAKLLGRDFSLTGTVIQGNRKGRELGFPTANLDLDSKMMLPGDGIYASWAVINGERLLSATSVGVRPTFGLSERLVEVYVMDFDADLYGQEISVEFVQKLRDQEKFANLEGLVRQVELDVANARLILDARKSASLTHGGGTNFA